MLSFLVLLSVKTERINSLAIVLHEPQPVPTPRVSNTFSRLVSDSAIARATSAEVTELQIHMYIRITILNEND